ncbi:MAG: type IV pilus twitching motility protein PilT [Planctomycetota bacterium]
MNQQAAAPIADITLQDLLRACVAADASDLHLAPGEPPWMRGHGQLERVPGSATLTPDHTRRLAQCLDDDVSTRLQLHGAVDGSVTANGNVRFRFNIFQRRGGVAIALRRLEDRFRTLADLGLPDSLYDLCDQPDGLVAFAGPTGAGKSTTLATLIDRINQQRAAHIVTIEDPIEYVHTPARCLVNQRQVGTDADSFHSALVAALRQDPDVLLVGEIRDVGTIRTAIQAAETGHLVFTTVHAADCVSAVERLVSVFEAGEQDSIRRQLALVLRAIVTQHLVVADGTGVHVPAGQRRPRVAVSEILRVTPAVANLIATSRSAQIASAMETGGATGMQTLDQDLARLWHSGRISEATAVGLSRNPTTLRDRATRLRSATTLVRPRGGGR